jgi:hypothetical protein
MNTRAILGVALTGAVVLVSCTQDQTSAPSLTPTEASSVRGGTTNYCSISSINTAAKAYFALRNDDVYGLIETMKTAYNAGGATTLATNNAGFAVLARLGVAADAPSTLVKSTATPEMGSAVANAVLKCMTVAGFEPADGEVIPFAQALGANGLFAVRANDQSTAVYSRAVGENGPLFGAEPSANSWPIKTSTTGSDAVSPSGKALFYGWKTGESTGELSGEDLSSISFRLHSLPTPLSFNPKIRVGVCSADDPNARTVHVHDLQTFILGPGGALSFCTESVGSISPNLGTFAFATQQLANWLAPKPLFAAPFAGGGGAGLVDGLSEFGAVEYTPVITWDQAPGNTGVKTSPQFRPIVKLTIKTFNGTPYLGSVSLNVIGNSGSFNIDGHIEDTDATGVVTFPDLVIDKAGGYTMTAVTGIGTSSPVTFWINGQ